MWPWFVFSLEARQLLTRALCCLLLGTVIALSALCVATIGLLLAAPPNQRRLVVRF